MDERVLMFLALAMEYMNDWCEHITSETYFTACAVELSRYVTVDELNDAMEAAQKSAFKQTQHDSLPFPLPPIGMS